MEVVQKKSEFFHFRDKNVFLGPYKLYVRPHLEFALQPGHHGKLVIMKQ
jgi:hypothetical protein